MTARLSPTFKKLRAGLAQGSRRGLRIALRAGGIAASLYLLLAVVVPFVRGHEYFRLRTVRVTCDHPAVSPRALASIAGLWNDATIWDVDVADAEAALEDIPWVADATVARRFPWQVSVHVHRRHAIAATLVGDGVFLVDGEGAVFRDPAGTNPPDLVFVRGWNETPRRGERLARLRRSLALAHAAEEAGYKVSEVAVDAGGTFWLYPETPRIAVALGANPDPEAIVRRFDQTLARLEGNLELAEQIDLGWSRQVVVRTRGEAARKVLAARLVEAGGAGPADAMDAVEERGRG